MLIGGVGDYAPHGAILDDAILYAAIEGADVITMSLTVGQTSAIDAAIETAHNTYGCFIDCASGNNSSSTVSYPARADYVFAVGATAQNDQRVSFSNYGNKLDAVAPGVYIWSTRKNNSYGVGDGTSYAAPQVAGIAALLKSYNQSYSNTDIEMIIATSAEKVGGIPYNETRQYGPWDDEMGYGRVNAFYAVAPPAAPQNLVASSTCNQCEVQLDWDANIESDMDKYKIYRKEVNSNGWTLGYELVATVNHPTISWIDEESVTNVGTRTLYYQITGVDLSQNESAYSNEVNIWAKIPKVAMDEDGQEIREFKLLPNFPNPFNPETTIRFELPEKRQVKLSVYTLNGKKVATLINGVKEAGEHEVGFNASQLSSGLYFYQITAGKLTQTREMLLVK